MLSRNAAEARKNALAMLAMTAFTLMTRRGICEMQNVAPRWQRHSAGANRLQGKMKQYRIRFIEEERAQ
ncbi:hypothetical protein KZ779_00130 [Escherichia coli]|nr:hypothetical protein [Escherichia coli]